MALPAYLLNMASYDPHGYVDDITAAPRARHDKALAVDARQLAHQTPIRPHPLIIPDGVAVGWHACLASQRDIMFGSHGLLKPLIPIPSP
jgi:hypothetical protein